VICLATRAPGDSLRPRRPSGSRARPLNFTVRSHLGGISVAKSKQSLRLAAAVCGLSLTGSSCRRLRLALQGARAATGISFEVGARARATAIRQQSPAAKWLRLRTQGRA
jgi:hypothetical protein